MMFYEYKDGAPVLSIYDLEKVSYYNDPQAHFFGGAKVRTSLEGKPQKFIDQLKQNLPANLQGSIQRAADRGGHIPSDARKAIDQHIRYVAPSQNRGQSTDLNTAKGKRTWIGPEGQGYAARGRYTGQQRKDPGVGSQIVQENRAQPRPRSGQQGVSSVLGQSNKRVGEGRNTPGAAKGVHLRVLALDESRAERAKMKAERKKRGVLRREGLEASRAKEVARVKAIEEFQEAKRLGKKKRLKNPQAKKSKEGKLSRKEKKRLQREAAQPTPKASPPPTPVSEQTPKKKLKVSGGESTPSRRPVVVSQAKPLIDTTGLKEPSKPFRNPAFVSEDPKPAKKLKASGGESTPSRRPVVVSQAKPQLSPADLERLRKPDVPFKNPGVDLSDLASGTQRKKKLKATSGGTKPSNTPQLTTGQRKPWTLVSEGNYPTTRERIKHKREYATGKRFGPKQGLERGPSTLTVDPRLKGKKGWHYPGSSEAPSEATTPPKNKPSRRPVVVSQAKPQFTSGQLREMRKPSRPFMNPGVDLSDLASGTQRKKKLKSPTPNPVNAPTPNPVNAPTPNPDPQRRIATQVNRPAPSPVIAPAPNPQVSSGPKKKLRTSSSTPEQPKKLRATSGATEVKSQPKKLRTSSSAPRVKSRPVPWHKRGVGAALNTRVGKVSMGLGGGYALARTFGLIGNSNRTQNARRAQQLAETQRNNPSSRSM